MKDEIKEITKVDKQLLDKIEDILASELNCKEYDAFYNYFNEIRKPNILIDIKDDENIKDYITNLKTENERLNNIINELKKCVNKGYYKVHLSPDKFCQELLDIINKGEELKEGK